MKITSFKNGSFREIFKDEICNVERITYLSNYINRKFFSKLNKLTTFICSNLELISDLAFYDDSNLINIDLSHAKSIGDLAFFNCNKITKVIITNECNHIGNSSFKDCKNISDISIQAKNVVLGTCIFNGCTNINTLHIGFALTKPLYNLFTSMYDEFNDLYQINNLIVEEALSNYSFENCQNVNSLTCLFNDNIIPENIFRNSSFESITIGNTIENIMPSAFESCEKLVNLSCNFNNLKVYDNAFNGCSKLSEFDFSNVLYLGTGSFRATLISDINLSKVEVIKTLAFANCNLLSKVYINPNVKELGNDVFKGTLNIIDIKIPNISKLTLKDYGISKSIRMINILKGNIFKDINNYNDLEKVILNNSIKEIPTSCFENLSNLVSINLDNIEVIHDYAFKNCSKLQVCNLNKVKVIGKESFANNNASIMILLPNIEEIGAQAFINNSFIEVALSDKLTIIRNETFKNCSKLNNVTGLKKVEEIGAQAFMNSSIKEISLYNKIRVINSEAFANCKNLSKVNGLESVHQLGEKAFFNTSLDTIQLDSVKEVGKEAFSNCDKLKHVSINKNVLKIDTNPFINCNNLVSASIPSIISLSKYAIKNNLKSLEINKGSIFEDIANYKALEEIILNKDIKVIPKGCFENCKKLLSISLDNIVEICENAFKNCERLENVNLSKLEVVGKKSFNECRKINSLHLPSIKTIGEDAFSYCIDLRSVVFGDNLKSIAYQAFSGCGKLERINVPKSLERIEKFAFSHTNMKKVELDFRNVSYVGGCVFLESPTPVVIIDKTKVINWDRDWDKGVKMHGLFSKRVKIK